MKSKMFALFVIGIALALMAGLASADTVLYFDEFDGTSQISPMWSNATDDGGDFTFGGFAVGQHDAGSLYPGRVPYAYFELPQSAINEGYTLTVKGRCTAGTWDGQPFVGLTFGTANWVDGNWFFTGWGGGNVMHADDSAAGGQTWFGGGGLSQMNQWYWMSVSVYSGLASFYVSNDGVNYTLRRDNFPVEHWGNRVGIITGWGDSVRSEYDWVEVTSGDTVLYFDDFDGTSPLAPTWYNATDDGGDFTFGSAVGRHDMGSLYPGRAPYAYFELPQSAIDAGYTLTVKGRCTAGTWDGQPFVGLTFGTANWVDGNWFFTGWGGGNVMHADDSAAGGQTWFGGGGLSQMNQWYWMRVSVCGGLANFYVSNDGVNYTLRRDNFPVEQLGNRVGIITGWGDSVTSEYDWVEVIVGQDTDDDGLGDACDPTPYEDVDGICSPSAEWKNHGEYVSCVAQAAETLLEAELITAEEKDAIVSAAARSDVGKPRKK